MKQRKLTRVEECPRCGADKETINHVFFQCPFARAVWTLSPLSRLYFSFSTDSIYENMARGLLPQDGDDNELQARSQLWPWIMWRLWKSRNDLCFSNHHEEVRSVISKATGDAREWQDAHKEDTRLSTAQPQTTIKWEPPPPGKLKCNVDASWKEDLSCCGVGWILREEKGEVKWVGAKTYPRPSSSIEAEAMGLVWAMNCLDNLGMQEVEFESDSKGLLMAVREPMSWLSLKSFTDSILKPRRHLKPSFGFRGREGNKCGDMIAKKASSYDLYYAFLDCCSPPWLIPLVDCEKQYNGF